MTLSTAISHVSVREWIALSFQNSGKARKELAYEMGCGVSTIKAFARQENTPSLPIFLCMCRVLGPSFVNFMLAKIGMTGARWIERADRCHRTMHNCIAELNQRYTDAYMDGVIDEDEERQLQLMFMTVNTRSAAHLTV